MPSPQDSDPVDITALRDACFRVAAKSVSRVSGSAPVYFTGDETLSRTQFRPNLSGIAGPQVLDALMKTTPFVFEVEFKRPGQSEVQDSWPEAARLGPVDQPTIVVNAYRGGAHPVRWHLAFTLEDGLPAKCERFFEVELPRDTEQSKNSPGIRRGADAETWWNSLPTVSEAAAKLSGSRTAHPSRVRIEPFVWTPKVATDFSGHPSAKLLPELEKLLNGLVSLDAVFEQLSNDFPARLAAYLQELALASVEEERSSTPRPWSKRESPLDSKLDERSQAENLLRLPSDELIRVLGRCSGRHARVLAYWKLCNEVTGEGLKFTVLVKELGTSPQTMDSSLDAVAGPQVSFACPRCNATGAFRLRRLNEEWARNAKRFRGVSWHFACHRCGHEEGKGRWGYSDEGVLDCSCAHCASERAQVQQSVLPHIIEGIRQVQHDATLAFESELAEHLGEDIKRLVRSSGDPHKSLKKKGRVSGISKDSFKVEMCGRRDLEESCPWQPANEFGCTVESMASAMHAVYARLTDFRTRKPLPSTYSSDTQSRCLSLLSEEDGGSVELKDWMRAFQADRMVGRPRWTTGEKIWLEARPDHALVFEVTPTACEHLPLPGDVVLHWSLPKLRGLDRLERVFNEARRICIDEAKALQQAWQVALQKRRCWLDELTNQHPLSPVLALVEDLQAGRRPASQALRNARDSLIVGAHSEDDFMDALNAFYWNFGVCNPRPGSTARPLLSKTAMRTLGTDTFRPPYRGIVVSSPCPRCLSQSGEFTFWGTDWSFFCPACRHQEERSTAPWKQRFACTCEGCVRVAQAALDGQDLAGMLREALGAIESKSLRLLQHRSLESPELENFLEREGIDTRGSFDGFAGATDISWKRVSFREEWASLAYALTSFRDLVLELKTLMRCDKPVVTKEALAALAEVCESARPDYGDGRLAEIQIRPLVVLELGRPPE